MHDPRDCVQVFEIARKDQRVGAGDPDPLKILGAQTPCVDPLRNDVEEIQAHAFHVLNVVKVCEDGDECWIPETGTKVLNVQMGVAVVHDLPGVIFPLLWLVLVLEALVLDKEPCAVL